LPSSEALRARPGATFSRSGDFATFSDPEREKIAHLSAEQVQVLRL